MENIMDNSSNTTSSSIDMLEKDKLVVSLCMDSQSDDMFKIIDSVSIPYEVLIGLGYTAIQTAFYLAWWFEALQKALESLSVKPEEVHIEFECEHQLQYTVTVKADSLDEAYDLMDELPQMVVTNLNEKISYAVKEHKFDALGYEFFE